MRARNTRTIWASLSIYALAVIVGLVLYIAGFGAALAIGTALLGYVILLFSIAPAIRFWELSPTAKHAMKHLDQYYSAQTRIPVDGGHAQGRGSIAGEPLFLVARYRKSGVVLSIHYFPCLRPRNIAVAWDDCTRMRVEDGSFVFTVRDMPNVEIRFPHTRSREFNTYVAPRMQSSTVAQIPCM